MDEKNETDIQRKRNAEQAFFEFIPIDDDGVTETDSFTKPLDELYPNTVIYRDFRFGKNLDLLVTDYRSYRPDHMIPEDGFPGKVVMDKEAIIAFFNAQLPGTGTITYELLKNSLGPYVNMDQAPFRQTRDMMVEVLEQHYIDEGVETAHAYSKASSDLSGNITTPAYNQLAAEVNESLGVIAVPLIDDVLLESLDRGLSYLHFGKQTYFSQFGTRNGIVKPSFDMYSRFQFLKELQEGLTPENVWGDNQHDWLREKIQQSDATFLGLASSVSTTSMVWDFSDEEILPPEIRTSFYASSDQWDGFPNRRDELFSALAAKENSFILSGDIHASFVGVRKNVPDFTTPAVSSTTFKKFTQAAVTAFGALLSGEQKQRIEDLLVTDLEDTMMRSNPDIKYVDTEKNGNVVFTVLTDKIIAEYFLIHHDKTRFSYYDDPDSLAQAVSSRTFIFQDGEISPA